jgi:hypothetical protein
MKLLRCVLPLATIFLSGSLCAQIEATTENIESEPFEEVEAFERQAAARGGVYQNINSAGGGPIGTSAPLRKKYWGQGGEPGFLAPPDKGTSEIETSGLNIEAEPFEEKEEFERRELAQEKKGEISITGDVRFRWTPERKDNLGYRTRGSGAENPIDVPGAKPSATAPAGKQIQAPTNYFEGEFNLYADFDGGDDWVETHVRFKSSGLGVASGAATKADFRKGWIGYEILEDKCNEIYVELGRKAMSSIFDSRIEFSNLFDGILLTWARDLGCVGDLKVYGGPFIIDYLTNHYGWVSEGDVFEIMDTGFYTKYSFIYWRKKGVDRYGVLDTPNYRFANSQIMLGYDFCPDLIGSNFGFYGAYLYNHAAKVTEGSLGKKRNYGWYVAFEWGKIGNKGDFLIDICYQDVGAQAVSNLDVSGIGRGNSIGRGDLPATVDPLGPGQYNNPQVVLSLPAYCIEGNNNFRGIELRTYYSLSDRITIKATTDYSWEKIRGIGGKNRYMKFDLQTIYDF